MIAVLALLAASLAGPADASAATATRVALHTLGTRGCAGLPAPAPQRELWIAGRHAVDPGARFWVLDRSRSYADGKASTRYRLGDGSLRVDAELAPDFGSERIRVWIDEPVAAPYLQLYLPGVALPCERQVDYRVSPLAGGEASLEALARFDALLHEATELGYDQRFAESDARLRAAIGIDADDPAPHWMRARTRYLKLESRDALAAPHRVAAYGEAEAFADRAVALAPDRAEGYLWQGILRGRMVTSQGSVRTALNGMVGGRGPAWLERALSQAVSLPGEYRFFGFSTHGNALHALAQFYRLAPDAWYMAAVGTRGDIDRAIDLSRAAVATQTVRIEFRLELAVALLCRGSETDLLEARSQLKTLLGLPAVTEVDRVDQTHARRLLRGTILDVCAYSRDAVPEVAAWGG
ncbi:MAG: hypothetical protein JRG82_14350 [Deltaproteobacteria bacterium]|nr:hypothetical protein [Deltaproteobacteria bacterium]